MSWVYSYAGFHLYFYRFQVGDDHYVSVAAITCPLAAPPFPDCELVDNSPGAEYPDCCPTFRCPDRCFSESQRRWFSVGEKWTEEDCTSAICKDTDNVALSPCGFIALEPHCRAVDGNATADYPECCPTVECDPDTTCFVPRLNRHFAVGESWTEPGCSQATCREGGGISGKVCGLIGIPAGHPCSVDDGDDSLEYPQCCPKVTCRECYSERLERFFGPGETWTEEDCVGNQCKVRHFEPLHCSTFLHIFSARFVKTSHAAEPIGNVVENSKGFANSFKLMSSQIGHY